MMGDYFTSIFRPMPDGDMREIPLRVEYNVYGGVYKGRRDSLGVPIEPDDETELEIEWIWNAETGSIVRLTEQEERAIGAEMWQYMEHQKSESAMERALNRMDD
jgi:hypothetical protein